MPLPTPLPGRRMPARKSPEGRRGQPARHYPSTTSTTFHPRPTHIGSILLCPESSGALELNETHPSSQLRFSKHFRTPKPKPVSTITQNPRPRSHEKPVTQSRRIRDPRLTSRHILFTENTPLNSNPSNFDFSIFLRVCQQPRPPIKPRRVPSAPANYEE